MHDWDLSVAEEGYIQAGQNAECCTDGKWRKISSGLGYSVPSTQGSLPTFLDEENRRIKYDGPEVEAECNEDLHLLHTRYRKRPGLMPEQWPQKSVSNGDRICIRIHAVCMDKRTVPTICTSSEGQSVELPPRTHKRRHTHTHCLTERGESVY